MPDSIVFMGSPKKYAALAIEAIGAAAGDNNQHVENKSDQDQEE